MSIRVLDVPLYSESFNDAVANILTTSVRVPKKSRCISATGAHGIIHSRRHPEFKKALQNFYINLPDGMPGVWVGRLKGAKLGERNRAIFIVPENHNCNEGTAP